MVWVEKSPFCGAIRKFRGLIKLELGSFQFQLFPTPKKKKNWIFSSKIFHHTLKSWKIHLAFLRIFSPKSAFYFRGGKFSKTPRKWNSKRKKFDFCSFFHGSPSWFSQDFPNPWRFLGMCCFRFCFFGQFGFLGALENLGNPLGLEKKNGI